jgi:metal-sulfur cluster biosynthetic enzyme
MPEAVTLSREYVLDALREVIDPELGYNIADIGLIYDLKVTEGKINVTMTMTTPGCPAQEYIMMGVQDCARRIPGVRDVNITLVWDPPWSPQMMTQVAKAHFHIPDERP